MDPADEAGADNAGDVGLGTATDGVPLAGSSVGEAARGAFPRIFNLGFRCSLGLFSDSLRANHAKGW